MRLYLMFVTAVCVLFLIKLRWPKKKNMPLISLRLLKIGSRGLYVATSVREK